MLGRWLDEAGATRAQAEDLALAASEACANAIEHAYGPAPGLLEVSASISAAGEAVVAIRDFGNWRAPRGENRGRGLMLMEGLTDSVEVVQRDEGTTVQLSRRLGAEAAMSANIEFDHRDSIGIARLSGDVDITQASALREQLLGAVRNDDLGLVVDLTDARYIDSVGVSLLFELAERLAGRQLRFAVVVPDEGLVERVLTIVDLDSVAEVHPARDAAALRALAAMRDRTGAHTPAPASASPSAGIQSARPPSSCGGSEAATASGGSGSPRPPVSLRPWVQAPPAPWRAARCPSGSHVVLRRAAAAHGDRGEGEAALRRDHDEPPATLGREDHSQLEAGRAGMLAGTRSRCRAPVAPGCDHGGCGGRGNSLSSTVATHGSPASTASGPEVMTACGPLALAAGARTRPRRGERRVCVPCLLYTCRLASGSQGTRRGPRAPRAAPSRARAASSRAPARPGRAPGAPRRRRRRSPGARRSGRPRSGTPR